MNAASEMLSSFLRPGKQYHLCQFPGGFRWEIENCEAFLNTLKHAGQNALKDPCGGSNHFLGNILFVNSPGDHPTVANYLVLKGKQRLIGTMLFLKALSDAVEPHFNILKVAPSHLRDCIYNHHGPQDARCKVIPRLDERDVFYRLIEDTATSDDLKSRLGKALQYFKSQLGRLTTNDLDTLSTGFTKISILCIQLDPFVDDLSDVVESFS